MKCEQATRILAVIAAAATDVLVERVPGGWRASMTLLESGDSYSGEGIDPADALGQVTMAVAFERGVELEPVNPEAEQATDSDQPIPFMLEPPLEFCKRFVRIEEEDETSATEASLTGNLDRAVAALTVMAVVR